jgi:hypothetical protein
MKDLEGLHFLQKFNVNSQAVLEAAWEQIEDRHLHFVTGEEAEGISLVLETVCRINQPTLIIANDDAGAAQWKAILDRDFIPPAEQLSDYLSESFMDPGYITIVTTGTLRAAYERLRQRDTNAMGEIVITDYNDFNLVKAVLDAGIKTVCVDERQTISHERIKAAVERFLEQVAEEANILTLAMLPEHGSVPGMNNRLIPVVRQDSKNEVAANIVALDTLCPHHDYVFFEYPPSEVPFVAAAKIEAAAGFEELLPPGGEYHLLDISRIPREATIIPRSYAVLNAGLLVAVLAILAVYEQFVYGIMINQMDNGGVNPLLIAALAVAVVFGVAVVYRLIVQIHRSISPKHIVRGVANALVDTMVDMGIITSVNAEISLASNKEDTAYECALVEATDHEKALFSRAVDEMLSPIGNPRYLVVRERTLLWLVGGTIGLDSAQSYACPSFIVDQSGAQLFLKGLKRYATRFRMINTRRTDVGAQQLERSRAKAQVSRNTRPIRRLIMVAK